MSPLFEIIPEALLNRARAGGGMAVGEPLTRVGYD